MPPNSAGFRFEDTFINLSRVQAVYGAQRGRVLHHLTSGGSVETDVERVLFRVELFSGLEFERAGELATAQRYLELSLPPEEYERFLRMLECYWSGA